MKTYRVYCLDDRGRITRGQWVEAHDDDDIRRRAAEIRTDTASRVEIWEGQRPLGPAEAPNGAHSTNGSAAKPGDQLEPL